MLFLAMTVVAGCVEPASGAYFPQHSLTEDDPLPDALLEATLERVDDCIWLRSAGGERYLGIWPASFELRDSGGTFEILDGEGTSAEAADRSRLVAASATTQALC